MVRRKLREMVRVRVDEDLHAWLVGQARGGSVGAVIRQAVRVHRAVLRELEARP